MFLILDSNAFYGDPNVTGADFKLLADVARKKVVEVLVPEVVFEEVANTGGERMKELVKDLEIAGNKLQELTESGYKSDKSGIKLDDLHKQYEARLRYRLKRLPVVFLPYPKVSHQDIAARDRHRRKPFNANGRGYRDALIWESVLEHVAAHPGDYVLVTENHRDFCADKNNKALHEHLVQDLSKIKFAGKFAVSPKLSDALDTFVKPLLARAESLKHELQAGSYSKLDIKKALNEAFSTVFDGINKVLRLRTFEVDLEEPFGVSGLYDAGEFEVLDVIELSDGEIYIELEVQYEADVYAFVFHSEAYGLDDESTFHVSDWDWNEHYVQVSATIELTVRISLTFDPKEEKVTSVEVTEASYDDREM